MKLVLVAAFIASFSIANECDFSAFHPVRYPLYPLESSTVFALDGNLNESFWKEVPWTSDFVDIQGKEYASQPWFNTRAKMVYDSEFLYIGAMIQDTTIFGTLRDHNSIVYHDNDFEVFIDPTGSTHNYTEVEVNVLNTTWNLRLNRPYRDGGHENSTRVDPVYGIDLVNDRKELQTAVYIKGSPNDPSQHLHYWSVELRISLSALVKGTTTTSKLPAVGDYWRINFSRVQWLTQVTTQNSYEKIPGLAEENWVWAPTGEIAMHMPEHWGYVQFKGKQDSAVVPLDPTWNLRYLAFQIYYAQHAYYKTNQKYASKLSELYTSDAVHSCIMGLATYLAGSTKSFKFEASTATFRVYINEQGYVTVHSKKGNNKTTKKVIIE